MWKEGGRVIDYHNCYRCPECGKLYDGKLCTHCKYIPKIIEGIVIKPFEQKYITEKYLKWMRNPVIGLYILSSKLNYTLYDLERYVNSLMTSDKDYFYVILLNDSHIGNLRIGPIEGNRTKIGILIGEQSLWGNGIGEHAINWVIKKVFEDSRFNEINEIYADVLYYNERAIALYEKCKFKFDCVDGNFFIFRYERKDYVGKNL